MTLPVSIRVNVRAPFPTRVKGAAFIEVAKANGVWTLTPDYLALAPAISVSPTQVLALYDTATGLWSHASLSLISTISNEQLTVTADNTLSDLSHPYGSGPVTLYVNGQAFFSLGASPAFTISGTTVTWSAANSGVTITSTDTVVISYPRT